MKSRLLTYSAVVAIAVATSPAARADDQTPTAPAGTEYAPAPTVEEELVYLRDIIALQTLRLDEAEQTLARQNALIEAQAKKLASFERTLAAVQDGRAYAAADGFYTVKSGDTLGEIATAHDTTVGQLAAANNLRSPYSLDIGQRLAVPGGLAPSSPQLSPAREPAPAAQTLAEKAAQPEAKPAEPKPQRVAQSQSDVSPTERPDVTERAVDAEREKKPEETKPVEGGVQEVGVRPEEERPYLAVLTDVGGILTPKGSLYVEPSVDYATTSDNRFFFQGIDIYGAILIGAIEATDSDRRAINESVGVRYGITSRLEVDGRISYVSRHDRVSGVVISDGSDFLRDLKSNGIGDAEFGLHYQINDGRKFPYVVANLRAKAPTGRGPFDLDRNPATGVETELATGSGYWTVEPSFTFILPSDPAVIFANIGYQYNQPITPDEQVAPGNIVREFDAGDAIRASIGVGLSLNERLSVNFGYDQTNFFNTTSLIEALNSAGDTVFQVRRQPSSTVGAFLFGGSYALNDSIRLNVNTAIGATDEAPDMRISLRAQVRLFD